MRLKDLHPFVSSPLPGPRSAELLARQERWESNARTYPRYLPIAVADARGPYIRDLDGNVFLDFLTGAGTLPLGHNHPELVRVVTEQLDTLVHGLDFPTEAKDEFLQALMARLPSGMRSRMKVHFCGPGGADAVDAAVKLCKTATGRGDVIAFQGAYHGSSHAAMALTGIQAKKRPIANGVPGVHHFPFSYCSRCALGLSADTCATNCATLLGRSLEDGFGGTPLPAAAIMEPVQGEGGVIPATVEFAREVRRITRELGIPLIVDEVQTGCGRTGKWFAFEHYGIEPDVIVASKSLSGIGLPIAVIVYDRALDVWQPGAHVGTFRGNQLAFAAGAETMRLFDREQILANVRARALQVERNLLPLRDHDWVREVRGLGLMWGVELADPETGRPCGRAARAVQREALQHGLILECGGRDDSVLRLLPPLNVTADVVDRGCAILTTAIEETDLR
jgi:diaminobutyrate-2-oxoglutarate transaminase